MSTRVEERVEPVNASPAKGLPQNTVNATDKGDAGIEDTYQQARKRVEELRSFYVHVGVFAIVNLFLFGLNMLTDRNVLWFYWPLGIWGAALVLHTFTMLFSGRFLGPKWEERKIHEYMARENEARS